MNKIRTGMILVALIATLITGCTQKISDPTNTASASTKAACLAAPDAPVTSKPVIAVMAGATSTDTNPDIAKLRTSVTDRVVTAGAGMGARFIMSGVGSSASSTTLAINTQLDDTGPNPLARKMAVRCKHDGIISAITTISDRPTDGPLDVFGGLRSLSSHLTGLSAKRIDVIILSSTLNATAPVDLTDPTVLARPTQDLVDTVSNAGVMADCHGWNVYIVGGGRTSVGSISVTDNSRVQAFWTALFSRCGGRVALYDSDLTQYPVPDAAAPTGSGPGAPAVKPAATTLGGSEPTASLVGVNRRTGARSEVVFTLPVGVLFDRASATLSAGTEPILTGLLTSLTRNYPSEPVAITGFTDSTPYAAAGGNQALSERRAGAVAAWLLGHGIAPDRITCAGHGEASPVGDNATPDGRAANRRVEIAVTVPTPPAP